jgi:integral membrane protein (TIGR01906 family)
MTTNASTPTARTLPLRLLRLFLITAFPVLLVLIGVRLVMTPLFLSFEYQRAGFPADFYGFTTEDRLQYAPYALDYLLNGEDIDYLGNLTFPDGTPLYNERELRHMHDVKIVTQAAFGLALILGAAALAATVYLARRRDLRPVLAGSLLAGALLTLGVIAGIVAIAVANWDFFFSRFHQIFFEGDTWTFAYSDTLIRLFPEQFWFDAALAIGLLTVIGSLVALAAAWRWLRS